MSFCQTLYYLCCVIICTTQQSFQPNHVSFLDIPILKTFVKGTYFILKENSMFPAKFRIESSLFPNSMTKNIFSWYCISFFFITTQNKIIHCKIRVLFWAFKNIINCDSSYRATKSVEHYLVIFNFQAYSSVFTLIEWFYVLGLAIGRTLRHSESGVEADLDTLDNSFTLSSPSVDKVLIRSLPQCKNNPVNIDQGLAYESFA